MRLRDRDVLRIVKAPFQWRHWRALSRMVTTYDQPIAALTRYLTNSDDGWPWTVRLHTPRGPVSVMLRDRHDLLTVNEIFCRQDYGHDIGSGVVLDIGANVGLAALWWLTRNDQVFVYCYEPDPANIAQLRRNLHGFQSRYHLTEKAVTPDDVTSLRFVPAGRYGHTAREDESGIELPAIGIAQAVSSVLSTREVIDLVKIDTEGSEPTLVAALTQSSNARAVRRIVFEDGDGHTRWVTP